MNRRLLLALPLALVALPAAAAEMACAGPFAADSSERRLIETFGRDNVVTGEVPGPEGSTVLATTLFPDDDTRRIEIGWWNEKDHADPAYITVPDGVTAPGGVRSGQTVAEVEELNGEPFKMSGFQWDYSGAASFQSGRLAELPGGCSLLLRFAPTEELPEGVDPTPVLGDVLVASDNETLLRMAPVVASIRLRYADPSLGVAPVPADRPQR
jgi:hypothetical protein